MRWRGRQHRQPEAALKLAHAEGKLCLAEGSDSRWLQLQMCETVTEQLASCGGGRRVRQEEAHPVSAKAPVESAGSALRIAKSDRGATAAAAGEAHDFPSFELVEKANAPMML
jgi:hypothetical protein